MLARPASRLAVLAAVLAVPVVASAATRTWSNSAGDSNWSNTGNWGGTAPVNGDDLVFTDASGAVANQPTNNNISSLSLRSITFANSTFNGPLTLGGNAFTLDTSHGATTTLINSNTTAGRDVTIGNNITVAGNQTWQTASDVDAVTTINGNLSGSGNIIISGLASNNSSVPTIRLGGNNSAYTGTISMAGGEGVLLLSAQSQTSGLIDLNSGNRNLWLKTNSSATPYTFWTGNATPTSGNPMNVNFRNAGTSGVYLADGDVYWNPTTSGNDYQWNAARAGTNPEIRVNGSNTTTPAMLYFGNSSGSLVLGGNRSFTNGAGGNNAGRVTMNFALSDDGTARNFTSSAGLMVLTRTAGGGGGTPVLSGDTVISGGATALTNMDRIFNGWLNLSGGVILLDNVSWANFTADRAAGYRASTGVQNTWGITGGGGGFAARGSALSILIDNTTPSASYGTITAETVFNRDFALGSAARDATGSFYANAGVTVAQHTALSGMRTINVAATGLGRLGESPASPSVGYTFSGNISGTGALVVASTNGSSTGGELGLAGTYSATGNAWIATNTTGFNTGRGGLGARSGAWLRFDGPNSLPTGAPLNTLAYVAGMGANNGASMQQGILFGPSANPYRLNPTPTVSANAYRLAIGGGAGGQWQTASFGATGTATLTADVAILADNATATGNWGVVVRDGAFTLGDGTQAFRLIPATFAAQADAGLAGSATAITDATGVRTMVKTGGGTLVLGNVGYTDVAGTANTASRFAWQIGRGGSDNTIANPYFDGAIRETGATSANSLTGFLVKFQGGVLETNGNFNRALGTGGSNVQWAQGGGGFSAYASPLTVNIGGAAAALTWASTSNFVTNNNPMVFGANTGDDVVTWKNPIALNGAVREIRVVDNVNASTDYSVIDAVLSGTGSSGLAKTGAGKLVLNTGVTHTYAGATNVNAGTLLVNGTLNSQTSAVTVASGATLGGDGTINRPISVLANGKLSPGNSPGLLDVTGNVAFADEAIFEVELNGSSAGDGTGFHDRLAIVGSADITGADLIATLGYTPSAGDKLFILTSTTGLTGTFDGLADDAVIVLGSYTGIISYNGDVSTGQTDVVGGNDIVIHNLQIPEPASLSLLATGAIGLLRRRR